MLHADAGIHLPESKATLVYSRLAKRLRALGLESFRDYCALLREQGGADERQQMLAALTTNVTRFFREPHHFEHLRKQTLPPLVDVAQARRPSAALVGRLLERRGALFDRAHGSVRCCRMRRPMTSRFSRPTSIRT